MTVVERADMGPIPSEGTLPRIPVCLTLDEILRITDRSGLIRLINVRHKLIQFNVILNIHELRKSNCLFYKYLIFIYFYQIMNF